MSKNNGYKEVSKQPRNKGKFVCKEDEPMVNLNIRVPASVAVWIENQAKQTGLTKTEVARQILSSQVSA